MFTLLVFMAEAGVNRVSGELRMNLHVLINTYYIFLM